LLLFLFIFIFSVFCQTNYLNICRTDLHEICRIGRTLAVDKRAEVIYFDPKGRSVATNFVGKLELNSIFQCFVNAHSSSCCCSLSYYFRYRTLWLVIVLMN